MVEVIVEQLVRVFCGLNKRNINIMGCDIHCYIEYKRANHEGWNNWSSFGGRINPGRDYTMFRLLAGVRSYDNIEVKPKGLPENCGYSVNNDNYLYITESVGENYATAERAKYYVEKCGCKYRMGAEGTPTWVSQPDWHSHSWMTTKELTEVFDKYKIEEQKQWDESEKGRLEIVNNYFISTGEKPAVGSLVDKPYPHNDFAEYKALLAAMLKFEELGYETRLVYWFDN
jgi:hypothetical protein